MFSQHHPSNINDQMDNCLAQPARSSSGCDLILTGAEFASDLIGSQVLVNTYLDSNHVHPMAIYKVGVRCLLNMHVPQAD